MPTNRKFRLRSRQGITVLSAAQKTFLLHGLDLRQFDCDDDALAAWRLHGAELLAEFIREHPGRRPYGWWRWRKPAGLLRRQIYGPLPLLDSPIHWGIPVLWPNSSLIFESEVEFLQRNHLLTRGESRDFLALRAVARAAQKDFLAHRGYRPEELDEIFADWDACADQWSV